VEFTESLFIPFLVVFYCGLLLVRKWSTAPSTLELYIAGASLVFYALWYPPGVVWLLAYTAVIRVAGEATARGSRSAPAIGVALCLFVLGVFKYFDFFVGWFTKGVALGVALPLGISFYAFTAVGYLLDVRRDPNLRAKSYLDALLLISFWPHLAAGPILRARDVLIAAKDRVRWTPEVWALALLMIASGHFARKVVSQRRGPVLDHPLFGLPEHSVDVLIFGDSTAAWGISPRVIERVSRLRVAMFADEGMPLSAAECAFYRAAIDRYLAPDGRTSSTSPPGTSPTIPIRSICPS
jgi:alginate O-acetyltransferase complex protein AlgI